MRDYSDYYPSYKEVILENGRLTFEQQLRDFEGKEVVIDGGTSTQALVTYHQNPINEFKENRKIKVWHETGINRGSLVETVEDSRVFLVISQVNQNDMVKYALMRQCNHTLNWINSANTLIHKPAITTAQTLYTTGVKDEKVIEIPDGMQGIQLPHDEDTMHLNRGDCFVFNKARYRITFLDNTTYKGLLNLICTEEPLSETDDDMVNEIANRYYYVNGEKVDRLATTPEEPINPDEPIATTTYSYTAEMPYPNDPDNEIFWDTIATYTIHKFVDEVEVNVNFTFTLSDTTVATITNTTDNSVSVKATTYKYGNTTLIVTDVDTGEIVLEKEIKIIGM